MTDGCEFDKPEVFQIRVKGILGSGWSDWFDDFTIALQANGETLLTGPVRDQAALHGLLNKIRDVGLPLLSVQRVEFKDNNTSIMSTFSNRRAGGRGHKGKASLRLQGKI
jgi:hypothetical protein